MGVVVKIQTWLNKAALSRDICCIPVAYAFPDVATLVDFVVQQMLCMLLLVDLLPFDSYRIVKRNFLLTKCVSEQSG